MNAEIVVLRLVHVLGGALWVGSALFSALFLAPALATAGPAAGQVMAGLQRRRLFTVLPIVGLLTILSGARLMAITSGGFGAGYFATTMGRTYAASAVAALVAFAIGLAVARPAAARAARAGQALAAAADAAERTRLAAELDAARRRGATATAVATALVVLAAAGMAVARYLV